MAITFFGASPNPVDNGSLDNAVIPIAITPPASMVTGDLVVVFMGGRSSSDSLSVSATGGQTWTSENLGQAGSLSTRAFWCRYNGTWSVNPSFTDTNTSLAVSLLMVVFRPTTGTNTWALDTVSKNNAFSTPVSPGDVTATPNTPAVASSTVTVAAWIAIDNCAFTLNTGSGYASAGSAQYRNLHTADAARQLSTSAAYKVLTSSGAISTVTNQEDTSHLAQGRYMTLTFKEQSSGITISAVSDGVIHNGETGVTITGTSFGASHTGSADVIISPTNSVSDGSAVVQTQTSWANTSVAFTANLASFGYFTNLYVFVKDSSGASNSSGFVIQREAWASITGVLKNLAGATVNSASSIVYYVRAVTANGTLVLSNTNGTTDGSGNFTLPTYVLTNGGPLAVGDSVWVSAAFDGASLALSPGTLVKVTPTYS